MTAVIPADARRFRVTDPALGDLLREAGADVTEVTPDVELGAAGELRGEGEVAVAILGRPRLFERPAPVRVASRVVTFLRVRLAARRARRTVLRLGYSTVLDLTWDPAHRLRNRSTGVRKHVPLRQRFPERGLIVGCRVREPRFLLDDVVSEAMGNAAVRAESEAPLIMSGGLLADVPQGLLRVAVGFGSRQIRNQTEALEALGAADATSFVAERVPCVIASGQCGLAEWSLEERLRGARATHPVGGALLADCVEFLVALHSTPCADGPRITLREQFASVEPAADTNEAAILQALVERLEAALAGLPRGFGHGDFFHGNLLAERDRLVGVVDWDAAGPDRLPLLDLLHLRHATQALAELDWGPKLVEELLPWARAGGDDTAQRYCQCLGVRVDSDRLQSLVLAYWLDRVSYHLRSYPFRWAQPLWLERNVSFVLRAIAPTLK
ncbi:MAG: aminoglycoside phosphotransferase family protein [Solirubrobacteraceae bacterium]